MNISIINTCQIYYGFSKFNGYVSFMCVCVEKNDQNHILHKNFFFYDLYCK